MRAFSVLTRTAVVGLLLSFSAAVYATCSPKFLNPVTDVCWSCMFPITIFNQDLGPGTQTASDYKQDPVCLCPTRVGIPVGFYEPIRSMDVVKEPYCFLNLGFQIDSSVLPYDVQGTVQLRPTAPGGHKAKNSFYHVHYYTNPMLYWLELLLEDVCIERGGFDLAYLTEADPTWSDPQLAGLLNPDAFLYGNVIAVAACTADCIAATTLGLPIDVMHWCSGCQGTIYPLTGVVAEHVSGVGSTSILAQRLATKMHRMGVLFGTTGDEALCGYYPQFMMRKSAYKFQLTHPFPQDKRLTGKCCQPFGFSTALYEVGKNLPGIGEDFGYLFFRKRDCCNGVIDGSGAAGVSP